MSAAHITDYLDQTPHSSLIHSPILETPHSSLIHSPVAWNVTHARFCLVVAADGNPSKVMALVMPEIVDLWSRHISQVKFGFPGDQLGECMQTCLRSVLRKQPPNLHAAWFDAHRDDASHDGHQSTRERC